MERTKSNELQVLLKEREQKIQNLEAKLETAQRDNESLKQSATEMQKLMDSKELFLGPQATDQDIQTRFGALNSLIKTWSMNFINGHDKVPVFYEKQLSEYCNIAPLCQVIHDFEHLVSERKTRRLFVRGWTSYIISTRIFRSFPTATQSGKTPAGPHGLDLWLQDVERNGLAALETRLLCAGQCVHVGSILLRGHCDHTD
jgi:hypothetical protein